MTTKEEIKQKLMDLALELNAICYDAAMIPKLRPVWDKLVLLHESVEKLDDGWRDATKELPEFLSGKSYSDCVFAKVKGTDEIQVMCVGLQPCAGDICRPKWANCHGNINGIGYYEDDIEVIEWKYINF